MTTWRARGGGGGARIKIMGNLGLQISMPMPKDVSTSSKKIIDDGYTRETIMQNDFEPMLVNFLCGQSAPPPPPPASLVPPPMV